ncbi:MAG: DUF637 domain-containing protein [Endozoicomonas sp.]|uniref:DUF637 domain-containing protein n=1 Tax=Endozoicomonas sp. TaxID=1892382 RepID=UPI003D9BE9BD
MNHLREPVFNGFLFILWLLLSFLLIQNVSAMQVIVEGGQLGNKAAYGVAPNIVHVSGTPGKKGLYCEGKDCSHLIAKNVRVNAPGESITVATSGNADVSQTEIKANKVSLKAADTAHLTNTVIKAEEVTIQAKALYLMARYQLNEWETSNTTKGTGSRRKTHDQERHLNAHPSVIEAAESIHINTGTLMTEGAYLQAGTEITLDADQWFCLATVEEHFEHHEVQRKNLFKTRQKHWGKQWNGITLTRLNAPSVHLNVERIEAQVGIVPGDALETALDRLTASYPELAFLNRIRDDRTHWETIETTYREWKQKHEGLSPLAAIIIGSAVSVATYGVGASLLPASLGTSVMATNAANALFSSLVARGSVALANHGSNVSAALEEVFSKASLESVAVETITGIAMGAFDVSYRLTPDAPLALQVHDSLIRVPTRAGVTTVIKGGSLGDALEDAARREGFSQLAAQLNYYAGHFAQTQGWEDDSVEKIALHSATGAFYGMLRDGQPLAGAASGAAAQAVNLIKSSWDDDENWGDEPPLLPTFSLTPEREEAVYSKVLEVLSTLGAALAAQAAGGNPETGAEIGQAQEHYNRQLHPDETSQLWQKIEGKTLDAQQRYKAAACYITHCSRGVLETDKDYELLKSWEQSGALFGQEIWELQATGLFTFATDNPLKEAWSINQAQSIAQVILGGWKVSGAMILSVAPPDTDFLRSELRKDTEPQSFCQAGSCAGDFELNYDGSLLAA